jgi:glycosyltransferase involved in cell wall biosynthesis
MPKRGTMADTIRGEPTTADEKLCVLVPCLNEEELVRRTVEEVLRHADRISVRVEVVMIDDGSTDGTRAVMQELCDEDSRCRLIAHDTNRGLGRCVTEAYETIDDDTWVTVFPGDSEFVFAESIDNLLAARQGHDVVLGYLYNPVVRKLGRRIASTGFLKLTKTIYGFRWRSLNGMKLYRAKAFKGIHVVSGGHAYVAELLAKAQLRRPDLRITEAPFISRGRAIGDSHAIKPTSVLRAVHETYKGAQDVGRYRDEMVQKYHEEQERGEPRESFFPPPTID